MPRAERLQKSAVKELKGAAKASGQLSLSQFLKRSENDQLQTDGVNSKSAETGDDTLMETEISKSSSE